MSVDVVVDVTQLTAAPIDDNSDTTGTTRRAVRFDIAHYCRQDPPLRANQIFDFVILLHNISNVHILSLTQPLRVSRFSYKRETIFVSTTATANRIGPFEDDSLAIPCVLDKAVLVVLMVTIRRFHLLLELQNAKDVAWVEPFLRLRCMTRLDGRPNSETKVLKLINLTKNAIYSLSSNFFF